MRIHKNKVTVPGVFILLSIAVLLFPADVVAGMIRFADMGNGGGHAVNLTLEQITVTPIRAYIGNAVVVEVVIDNREEGSDSSNVEIYANKKVVANKMFRWGGAGEEKKTRLSFTWDTTG
ncbi:MAG: hypothetical protein FWH25_03250, partial [Syntrophorhabdaceae bacterium]|nr:hypothetical protein [Syntrophorhabdaceae bacterium]